ncbi:IS5 family transposase [bacterium]|nr:MAG: IS5 family transposase [bacterium]
MKDRGYPSDVSDEEWDFLQPYLCLLSEDVPQRKHSLRAVFNGLRYVARSGCAWRYLPHDLPPWEIVYQQTQRWLAAGVFETMAHDLRQLIRQLGGREPAPSAAIVDSRTLCSTCESGPRAGYDGAKKRSGSKIHIAVDTLGHLLALTVTPANQGDRSQVGALCEQVQQVTGENVQLVWVDQGYTGQNAAQEAQKSGIELYVVKLEEAKRGFVLLPRRWVVERSFAWANRFRRLVKDYERLPETLKGLHFLAFACLMLKNLVQTLLSS